MFGDKMRTIARETAPQINSEKLLQRGGGGNRMAAMLVKGEGTRNKALIFAEQGAVITEKDFSAFLGRRRYTNWTHKISC